MIVVIYIYKKIYNKQIFLLRIQNVHVFCIILGRLNNSADFVYIQFHVDNSLNILEYTATLAHEFMNLKVGS